ncbi:MAG: TatD family hydrolase [Chloroflexota bacterium]|nr:TatD family hydrolase [Chloroflexota bacterium]
MLIDSHCHLQFPHFQDDRQEVLERAWQAGLSTIVVVGTDVETSQRALALAEAAENVFATIGCHPHEAAHLDDDGRQTLSHLARSPKVVALGEIGLDFYRNLSPPREQRAVFQQMLDIAGELRLPVIIHSRAAEEETFAILSQWASQVRPQWPQHRPLGVMHCFGGELALALRYAQFGFLVSIPGSVTYPNSDRLTAVVAGLPLERMLIETDAPYLAPRPARGQRNEPAFLVHTAGKIAELRAQTVREVAERTAANAATLFGLPAAAAGQRRGEEGAS